MRVCAALAVTRSPAAGPTGGTATTRVGCGLGGSGSGSPSRAPSTSAFVGNIESVAARIDSKQRQWLKARVDERVRLLAADEDSRSRGQCVGYSKPFSDSTATRGCRHCYDRLRNRRRQGYAAQR
jgi:hypothetical protein